MERNKHANTAIHGAGAAEAALKSGPALYRGRGAAVRFACSVKKVFN